MRRTIFSVSLLLWLLAGCTFQSQVITVTLANTGTKEARNIEFRYPGGSFGVAALAPGTTYEYRIKPFHSGALEMEYLYGEARVRSTFAKVDKDQSGKATVALDESGVKWSGLKRAP